MKQVLTKLNEVREQIGTTKMKKSGYNPFLKFNYFELGDFLPAAQKLFREKGLFSNFSIKTSDMYNTASLTITDIESGESVEFTSHILHTEKAEKGLSLIQEVGKEHTYLKRYLWIHALALVEHDAAEMGAGKKPKKEAPKLDTKLVAEAKELNVNFSKLATYKKKTQEELTNEDLKEAIQKKGGK